MTTARHSLLTAPERGRSNRYLALATQRDTLLGGILRTGEARVLYRKPQYFCSWRGGDVFTFWQIRPRRTIRSMKALVALMQSSLVAAWIRKSST